MKNNVHEVEVVSFEKRVHRDKPARRRWGVFLLRVLITTAVCTFLLTWLRPADLFATMKKAGIVLWVSSVIFHILVHGVVVMKWRILLEAAGTRTELLRGLRAHGAGTFANLYLPSIVGGDVIRAGIVAPDAKSVPAVITGGIADRITDCLALIILAVGGLFMVPAAQSGIDLRILVTAAIGLLVTVLGIVVAMRVVDTMKLPSNIGRAGRVVTGLQEPIRTILRRKNATLLALVVSLVIQTLFILQNVVLGRAIGIQIPVAAWFVAWPLAKLASLTPFSVGGLGIREGVLAALLVPFSVPATLAVAESLLWQTIMFTLGLFGGLFSLWAGQHFTECAPLPTSNTGTVYDAPDR